MLLTTQLPAIVNLGAGCLAVMRTADIGTDWLGRIAANGAATSVPARLSLVAIQSVQVAFALTLGFIALGVTYYAILKGIEVMAGLTMLDRFLSIAQTNWPARWFGV